MKNKFFFGVVIFFLVTIFAFFFGLFRPFVGFVLRPMSQSVATAVRTPGGVHVAEVTESAVVRVAKTSSAG